TRERLALEDAIRKVEAESVRKARAEPRPAPVPPHAVNAGSRPSIAGAAAAASAAAARRDRPGATPGDPAPLRADAKFRELTRRELPQAGGGTTASSEAPRPAEPGTSARSKLLGARTSERPPQDLKMFRKPIAGADDLDVAPQAATPSRDAR